MKYEDFINRFEKRKPTQRGVIVQCPAHDDNPKTPSLSVGRAKDGGILLKCFAGCTSEQIVGSLGLQLKDLFAEERAVHFTPPVTKQTAGKQESNEKPVIEKIYSYQNETGAEVYQALRLKPKSFRQRHRDESGGWCWTMDGVVRVLYQLPKILTSEMVVIVEGEKDADNLTQLGYVATCNVGGAGKWMDAYTETLKGKDVVICGDADEPGRKHVELVFDSIAGSAKTVKVLKMPDGIKDASEYIETFKTPEEAKSAFDVMIAEAYPHVKGHKLPIYTIAECEADYKRFVKNLESNSFSLGKWLPSLGVIRPLVPGELAFIIGDTGIGKTGLAQSLAYAVLPLPVLMFELELPKELMFERFASMATKFTGAEVEAAYRSAPDETLGDLLTMKYKNLFICPESRLTVDKMEGYVRRAELKMGSRPLVVVIDYIQLLTATGPNRREKISDIAEGLKVMAKATNTIIIVTSQVSRPPTKDEDKEWEPSLHSAKESGSIENSCGLLLGAWRSSEDGGLLNIRVLKSTKGGAGKHVKCNFDGSRMIITERSNFDENQPQAPKPEENWQE